VLHLCWQWEEREMQYVGMELAYRCRKQMVQADINLLESILVVKSWWDTVDFIASNLIGHYFFTFPGQIEIITQKWINSKNMWLIRSCILFQLKYKEFTNFKLLQQFIHQHKYSNEFFIQKAIGWSLRQYAKFDAYAVRAFVTETELKTLSRREALKHFS
jgi:3-methyladenine DNA glycosylase AlkD